MNSGKVDQNLKTAGRRMTKYLEQLLRNGVCKYRVSF